MFQDYVTKNRGGKIKADAVERWQSRIVPRGLDKMGLAGAQQYLADYGRGIAAPKCIQLALQAEAMICYEMAAGFWAKAYELETGITANITDIAAYPAPDGASISVPAARQTVQPQGAELPTWLPRDLQPGNLVTMQPVDAPKTREYYIQSPNFLGQPKVDGSRLLITGSNGRAWYQKRSMRTTTAPIVVMDEIVAKASTQAGGFILDGEMTFLDWRGGEHRTGAQAAQVNMDEGHPEVQPAPKYVIFEAICANGRDLTRHTKRERIEAAAGLFPWLKEAETELGTDIFELAPTALTAEEKRALCEQQEKERREGEVWTHVLATYTGGKGNETFRTKYLLEQVLEVMSLTSTTAAGRLFGAIEVGKRVDGQIVPMGSVGTGYDASEMKTLCDRFKSGEAVQIRVVSQGLTENGQLWHARFDGFPEE